MTQIQGLATTEFTNLNVKGTFFINGAVTNLVTPGNSKVINQESDFPTQDATTITLEAGINYLLGASISSSKRFIYQSGALFTANNQFGPKWTYTGSGNMFTGTNVNVTLANITFYCPNGTFIDHTDSVGGVDIIVLDLVNVISCAKFGIIRDSLAVRINTSFSVSATDGLTITGTTNNNLVIRQFALFSTSNTFIGLDLGSAVTKFEVKDLIFVGPSGAIGISGLANSANIPANNIAMLTGSDFSGGMSNFNSGGITEDDIRWSYGENNTIPDTNPDALLSLVGNTTDTGISVQGTPVKVAGTFTIIRESHFTGNSAGKIIYNGERGLALPVDVQVTVEPATGNNKDISVYLAVNGTVVAATKRTTRADNNNPKNISIPWQIDFVKDKFIEIFVANETDTIDVTVIDASLRTR